MARLRPAWLCALGAVLIGEPAMAQQPVPALPIVSAWTTFQDKQEGAFALEVPRNWQAAGGTARFNALQFRNWVRVASPDGTTILVINDPNEGSYVVPSQLLAMAGFGVGSLYSGGGGTRYTVAPYQTGAQYALSWGLRQLAPFCAAPDVIANRELPSLTATVNMATGAFGMQHDVGEAVFRCTRNGVPMLADVLVNVASIIGQSGAIWYAESIAGFVAPAPVAGLAAGLLIHMLQSVRVNPDWVRRVLQTDLDVSGIAARTNAAISGSIMQSWESRAITLDQVMAEGSRARLGIDVYRNPATGEIYVVANTHQYYWANSAGIVTGTDTDAAPPGFSRLDRVPPGH